MADGSLGEAQNSDSKEAIGVLAHTGSKVWVSDNFYEAIDAKLSNVTLDSEPLSNLYYIFRGL